MNNQFVTGIIGAPFGIKGFVKVKPLSGDIEHLLRLKSAVLRFGETEKILTVAESAAVSPFAAIRFTGYNTPEAVKDLRGAELIVSREEAAALGPDEFYIEDINGLPVFEDGKTGEEGLVGHIAAITEGGGGHLAEIRLKNGKSALVPFRKDFFPVIDPKNGRLTLANRWILE